MTTSIVSMPSNDVSDFTGGAESDVAMMIGIGLVKDSPAVFFQYLGDEQTPCGLTMPSGKPVTSLKNITLSGISIAENVGEFNSTKLNGVSHQQPGSHCYAHLWLDHHLVTVCARWSHRHVQQL